MNILLIDDDRHLLNFLEQPLSRNGHSVTEARNGQQGWETYLNQPSAFDVIVTDIEMPVLTVVELLKRLREKNHGIPVIIMTGHQDIQFSIDGLRLGAFDFLLKPFKARELLDSLAKLESLQTNRKKALEELSQFREHLELTIPSHTNFIASAVSFLQDRVRVYCDSYNINLRNIGLCLHEALANAVIHGNLALSSRLKNESPEAFERLLHERQQLSKFADKQVLINCQINPECLRFEIWDQGRGFNSRSLQKPDSLGLIPTGRGILIIMALMDEVNWNEQGNCITMIKRFQPPPSDDSSRKTA
jgi:DNA-binding response OmpR family regulator